MRISKRLWTKMIEELIEWSNGNSNHIYSDWVQKRLIEAYGVSDEVKDFFNNVKIMQ